MNLLKLLCLSLKLCSTISGYASAIDGDTLVIDGFHIRLHGIDAEELYEPHGSVAKGAITRLLTGHVTYCRLTGDSSYDRYVAICSIDGQDIAEILIASGYALDCARYSHGKYRSLEPPGTRAKLRQKPYC